MTRLDLELVRAETRARLDRERPWHVFTYYEVGIVAKVRGRSIGDARQRLQRVCGYPPGCYTYRVEPFD